MRLRTWSRAAATAALFGLGACSCDDVGLTTTDLPSSFPGTTASDNYLSTDGAAFSENGFGVNFGRVQVFRNVDNKDAILTFVGTTTAGANYGLFASFFNGSTFTTPVQIRALDERSDREPEDVQVLFLNTSVGGRNGDAILLYRNEDTDDVSSSAASSNDANIRAYATYFDKSAVSKAATADVVHGFGVWSTAIDFNHVFDSDMDPMTDLNDDPNVTGVGFVSDSLHGTHEFDGTENGVLSGDETTFVRLAFYKGASNATTPVDPRWFTVEFPLDQDGNAMPVQSGVTGGMIAPSVGTLEDTDDVFSSIAVHDGFVAWGARYIDTNGEDYYALAATFAAGTTGNLNLGSDPTNDYDYTEQVSAANLYGPDHGLNGYYMVTEEYGFSNDMMGSRAGNTDVVAIQVDEGASTRSIVEIDGLTATVDLTDADSFDVDGAGAILPATDGIVVRDGYDGDAELIETAIHRDGGFVTIAMARPRTDVTDFDDTPTRAGFESSAPYTNALLYLTAIQTGNAAANLASSVLAAPLEAPAIPATGAVTFDSGATTGTATPEGQTQEDVGGFDFQLGVSNALAATQGGANDVGDAIQSNENRIFFRYTQFNDQAATNEVPNERRLFTAGLELTAGATPTGTLLRGTVAEAVVQFPGTSGNSGSDNDWGLGNFSAIVVDALDPAGDAVTFFVSNDNHVIDNAQTGAYTATRVYAWGPSLGSTAVLVSAADAANYRQYSGGLQARVVDDRIHLFWLEDIGAPNGSSHRLGTRSWSGRGTLTSVPDIAEAPAYIDLPVYQAISTNFQLVTSTTTVGVFFQEGQHVYFTDTTSDAAHYNVSRGLATPTLVDNDIETNISSWRIFRNDGTNELQDSFATWSKILDPWSGSEVRLNLVIHN